jgi:hypothetical protein
MDEGGRLYAGYMGDVEAVKAVRVEDSWITKEVRVIEPAAAPYAGYEPEKLIEEGSYRARQKKKPARIIRRERIEEEIREMPRVTTEYPGDITISTPEPYVIPVERATVRAPVGPMLVAGEGPPVGVKPVVAGLDFRVDSGVRKLLFLGVVASIVKGLSKS